MKKKDLLRAGRNIHVNGLILLLLCMFITPAAWGATVTDTLEDIGSDGTAVTSRVIGGITVTIETAPECRDMQARTYSDNTPIAFAGRNSQANTPLNPENVSRPKFISTSNLGNSSGAINIAQPIVFKFSKPVIGFGLTTLDLLENGVPDGNSLKLEAYNSNGEIVDTQERLGAQGASGIELLWYVSSDQPNITEVRLSTYITKGQGYGIDDLVVDIGDKGIGTSPNYQFALEKSSSKTEQIQLFNAAAEERTATLKIFNPHSELAISLESQGPLAIEPGAIETLSLQINAADAEVGLYDGILLEIIDDGENTLYSNITVLVTEQGESELPDLTVNAENIGVINNESDNTETYTATICNQGKSSASAVTVQFYDFGEPFGEAVIIPEIPANECATASRTVSGPSVGDRFVRVAIDPSNIINELDESNNEGSRIIPNPGGSGATGHILVNGSTSIGAVCPNSTVGLSGRAVYEISGNTDYAVKGGSVKMNSGSSTVYGDAHTDVGGNFKGFLIAPKSPGTYSVNVTVTDGTLGGTGVIGYTVLSEEDCASGWAKPVVYPSGPYSGTPGSWELVDPGSGTWEWVCSGDNCPSPTEQDVFVFSEDIAFNNSHPNPNDNVGIGAQIHHFASRTDISSGQVNVNINISSPGSYMVTLPPLVINNIAAGSSRSVFTNWRPPADGIYIVEVAVNPVELAENGSNNAATRAIFVGQSVDPNSKIGPLGEGDNRFITKDEPLRYTIFFENLETATNNAKEVVIKDQLDPDTMDVSTLSLGPITISGITVTPPSDASSFSGDIDLRPNNDVIAHIDVSLDSETGLLVWHFSSIDPATGLPTADPLAGFLPPNKVSPEGKGSVEYTLKQKSGLVPDTVVCNQAEIIFDSNDPILTSEWCNTVEGEVNPNTPPEVNAGENLSIASTEQCNTIVQGTASDEDGDLLEYRWLNGDTEVLGWSPVGENGEAALNLCNLSLSLGEHTLTLEVSDGQYTSSDSTILTIDNSAPYAAPTGGGVYPLGGQIIVGGEVSDYDGDLLTYSWAEGTETHCNGDVQSIAGGDPVSIPECDLTNYNLEIGIHTVTLTVSDGTNEPVSKDITIEVVDISKPTLAPESDIGILWPPNHKMVDITIYANASDNSGILPTLSATVTSNEPQEDLGDGDAAPDWTTPIIDQENGVITLQLRAERSALGEGRTYTISITAVDDSGNESSANMEIIVPHNVEKTK